MLEHGRWMLLHLHSEKQREFIMERLEKRAEELASQHMSSFYNPIFAKLAAEIPKSTTSTIITHRRKPGKRKAKVVKPKEPEVDSADNNDGSSSSDTDNDGDPDGQEDPPRKRPKKDGAAATQTTVDLKGIMKNARNAAAKPKSVTFAGGC